MPAFPTLDIRDFDGLRQTRNTLPPAGQSDAAGSLPVVIASNQPALSVGTETVSATLQVNRYSVTTSAGAIGSSAVLVKGISIKALMTNTIDIFIGPAGVTTGTGYPLSPGESISLPVTNPTAVYAVATVTGNNVAWIAL